MLIIQESITSNRLGYCDFLLITNSVFTRGKYAIPTLFDDLKVLALASDNVNLFSKASPNSCCLLCMIKQGYLQRLPQ